MNKSKKLRNIIKEHILNNRKEYTIVLLIFVIGIFFGVFFVNNMQEMQKEELKEYINQFVQKLKEKQELDYLKLLKTSFFQNLVIATIIWFFGTTVIGIPIVFGADLYRGFCLGYTISTFIYIMGLQKGIAFILIALLLQNLLFVPAILALSVSGFKLYKSIVKDKRRENVKVEIIRHTVFSLIMIIALIISSIIETFISTNFLKNVIKYF